MKERHAWNSHADKISGKTTKVEFILNGSKLEQRVTVEGKENSADVCKRDDDRPIFAQIACNKNITDNRHFKEKISKTYAEAVQSVGTSKSGREVFEQLMALNVLNEGNHDLKRTVGIDLKGIYMVGLRRMNC